jgi:hypothetical protein
LRTLIGARLDGVGAREHLLGPGAFGAQRVDLVGGPRVVETGLLVVEQRLVLVARPLRVVEDLLGGSASRLRQPGLHLAAIEVGAFGTVARTGVDLLIELGLLLVEALLLTVDDRLLAVTERLLEAGDALIGVKALLGAVLGHGRQSLDSVA